MFRVLVLLLLLPQALAFAAKQPPYALSGLDGKLKNNVSQRLNSYFLVHNHDSFDDLNLMQQVEDALSPLGYFSPNIYINHKKNIIDIKVDKGLPVIIHKITLHIEGEGKLDTKLKKFFARFPLKPGQVFNSQRYDDTKSQVSTLAESLGYLKIKFTKHNVSINKESKTANIDWNIDTGYRYYYGQLKFDPTYISPDLLYRYVHFKYGQPYKIHQLLTLNSNLAGSGYFNKVHIISNPDKNIFVPIQIKTKPSAPKTYTLGLGFGTDTGLRGRLGYQHIPLSPRGDKFSVLAQGSFKENALNAQYTLPGNNPVQDQYALTGQIATLDYNSGYGNSFLVSLAKQHHARTFQQTLSLNALYEKFNYTNFPKESINAIYPKYSINMRKIYAQLFSRDGYNINFNLLGNSKNPLSQLSFIQSTIDGKAAIMSPYLRLRVYTHVMAGLTETPNIYAFPLSLAGLLGGADNLRGYSFNSIGPGKHLKFASLELQEEVYPHWYILSFFDIGNVDRPISSSNKRDLGIGLMWVSPVGPIKIAVAQAVNDKFHKEMNTSPRLVINMGADL